MSKLIKVLKYIMMVLMLCSVFYAMVKNYEKRQILAFDEHLDDIIFTLDEEEHALREITYYVASMEGRVEKQATVYNKTSTKDYWNTHVDGVFISAEAKKNVLSMAVHDTLFSRLAREKGFTLDDEDIYQISCAEADFWEDLTDTQLERLPVSREEIRLQIENVALSEKYTAFLAEENQQSMAPYKHDGYYYSQMLKEHDLKTNDSLWKRLTMGEITLHHTKVNYINGFEEK